MMEQWTSTQKPIYDIYKSYEENFDKGPFFEGEIPQRVVPHKEKWIDFLGFKIASPLGVPAGPLLNSTWTTLAARLGFDVITYKTIRSGKQACQPLPNMIYVDTKGHLHRNRLGETLIQSEHEPNSMEELAVTNSFGVPSQGSMFLLKDIQKANNELREGQVLIVSAMGSHGKGDFIEDYGRSASLAKDAGAKIIEINFSCPNVATGEGSIYQDPDTVYMITRKVVKEIGETPLIVKVGYFTNIDGLRDTLYAIARGGAHAVCGINTIGMQVVNKNGESALGEGRIKSGICGSPIRKGALEFIKYSRAIIDAEKLGLTLIGVGGVTQLQHFDDMLDSGANIAMSATGMMWDPYLAMRWHESKI